MEAVEACLNRFHAHIRQIEYLMHAVDDRFFVRDNLAILISIGYFINGTMIEVPMGHQDLILTEESPQNICGVIGEPSEGMEQTVIFEDVIFRSYDPACCQKCNGWKKTAAKGFAAHLH